MPIRVPPEPKAGEPCSAAWGRLVSQAIRALRPVSSPTVGVTELTDGVSYHARPGHGGGGATAARTLWCAIASDVTGPKVAVSTGRVATLPLTIDTVPLGTTPAPKLAITTTGVVYIRGVFLATTGAPQSFSILNAAAAPADTATLGHKVLAEVDLSPVDPENPGAVRTITRLEPVAWNLSEVKKCGATSYLWGGFGG